MSALKVSSISRCDALKQYSNLLDSAFSVPNGMHFFDDFPVWNSVFEVPSVRRIGYFDENQLVSAAAIRLIELKTPRLGSLTAALIGAVVTHPHWRRKGLASQLIKTAVEWAQDHKACLVLLWSSEYHLYQKLGFQVGGEQLQVPLCSLNLPPFVGDVHQGWTPALFDLIRQREGGLLLKDQDRHWFEAHRNVKWYYTGTPQSPSAYVAFGRGIDLENRIHEWGGSCKFILQIISKIKKECPSGVWLTSPYLLEKFGFSPLRAQTESLCLAKVLNSKRLFSEFLDDSLNSSASKLAGEKSLILPKNFWIWGLDAS